MKQNRLKKDRVEELHQRRMDRRISLRLIVRTKFYNEGHKPIRLLEVLAVRHWDSYIVVIPALFAPRTYLPNTFVRGTLVTLDT